MEVAVILVFVVGYLAIALEHPIKINKTASALLTGVLCWTLFVLATPSASVTDSNAYSSFNEILKLELGEKFNALSPDQIYREFVTFELDEHLSSIAQILFFLIREIITIVVVRLSSTEDRKKVTQQIIHRRVLGFLVLIRSVINRKP